MSIQQIKSGVIADSAVTDTKLTLAANSSAIKTALNASGDAPIYACRAWVNFNGADTVAIRASGNVTSITDNGTGNYTVNFTTAMPDVNYALTCSAEGDGMTLSPSTVTYSTTAVRVLLYRNTTAFDRSIVSVAIFR